MSAVLLVGLEKINTAKAEARYKDTLISTQQALQNFEQYLKKQLHKYNISLIQDQIDSLIAKSRKLIYENAHDGQISQIIERKIEKDFKIMIHLLKKSVLNSKFTEDYVEQWGWCPKIE